MPSTLGSVTKSVFLNEIEAHKLHLEFEVGATAVKAGQPVELDSAGKVVPGAGGTASTTHIGIAIHDRATGELVTVGCHGKCVVNGEAKTAMTPGPVLYDSYDSTDARIVVDDTSVTESNIVGWCLDVAAAPGDAVRVLMK
jgi:hypothetical protein